MRKHTVVYVLTSKRLPEDDAVSSVAKAIVLDLKLFRIYPYIIAIAPGEIFALRYGVKAKKIEFSGWLSFSEPLGIRVPPKNLRWDCIIRSNCFNFFK